MERHDFLSMPEVAKQLGVTEAALRRLVQEGRLPVHRNPLDRRAYLIRRADLDAFLQPTPAERPHSSATEVAA